MADIITVGKAKLYQQALFGILNVKPELDIRQNYVRVFYPPNKLKAAQKGFKNLMSRRSTDLKIDLRPVIVPSVLGKYAPFLIGLLVAGIAIGYNVK